MSNETAFVPVAEKLRVAGRLLEEALENIRELAQRGLRTADVSLPMMLLNHVNLTHGMWGTMAAQAGPEYRAFARGDGRDRALMQMGELLGLAIQIDRADLERFEAQPDFAFKREVELIKQLRRCLEKGDA